jgi:Tol biopolymer transport system component
VINANGSGKRILTYHPAADHGPVWSPDGRKIAFSGDPSGIFVVNADGSGKRMLAHGGGPVWSPDGRKIAYSGDPGGVFVVNAGGSGRRMLARGRGPVWSPDGQKIIFGRFVGHGRYGPKHSSYVMSAEGKAKRRLTQDGGAVWSPDGRMIAVWTVRDGTAAIHVMRADGSGARRIARLYASGLELAWSPARGR